MPTLIYDLDNDSYYKGAVVTLPNRSALYSPALYTTNTPLPSPSYKAYQTEISYTNEYRNTICAVFAFDTTLISSTNIVTGAKLRISGKKGILTDNIILQIFSDQAVLPSGSSNKDHLIASIALSSFSATETEVKEVILPSHKLGLINRTTKTYFKISHNLATDNIAPTGINQFTFGHIYETTPPLPLKIQLVLETSPLTTTSTLPVVFDTISAPGSLSLSALSVGKDTTQCSVVSTPTLFTTYDFGGGFNIRPNRMGIGGPIAAKKLLVKYSFGFVTYTLTSPSAPVQLQKRDMRVTDGYVVGGDGQTRVGAASLSLDGNRAVLPWGAEGVGSVVYGGHPFSCAGSYSPPSGGSTTATAITKINGRSLAFSVPTVIRSNPIKFYISDITSIPQGVKYDSLNPNPLTSYLYTGPSFSRVDTLIPLETPLRSYLVAVGQEEILILDVSNPGPIGSGIASNFSYKVITNTQLGLTGTIIACSAAIHPVDGNIYILAETAYVSGGYYVSRGVSLSSIKPPTTAGGAFGDILTNVFKPVDTVFSRAQPASLLLSFESDLLAVYFEGSTSDGYLYLNARSSNDFNKNIAEGIKLTTPTGFSTMSGFAASGGLFHIYLGVLNVGVYAASFSRTTTITNSKSYIKAYNEQNINKCLLSFSDGFTSLNCSNPLSPYEETTFIIKDFYDKSISSYSTISSDGSRALVSCRSTPHNLILLSKQGTTYIPSGEVTSPLQYEGYPLIVKQGARYFGFVPGTQAGFVISDITNFIIPDSGSPGTVLAENYPLSYKTPHNLSYVETSSKKLVAFIDKEIISLTIVDVTSPGPIGSLVSSCPLTTIDLKPLGFSSIASFGITKHPITEKIYVTLLKMHEVSGVKRTTAYVYELSNTLQLINTKSLEIFAGIAGAVELKSNVFSFCSETHAYSMFLVNNSSLYPNYTKLVAFDLEKIPLEDISAIKIAPLENLLDSYNIEGNYNSVFKTFSLYVAVDRVYNEAQKIFSSFNITLKEDGISGPPSPSTGPSIDIVTITPSMPVVNDNVIIGVTATTGSGGSIQSYSYNFGDGSPVLNSASSTVSHIFTAAKTYNVLVTATDIAGGTGTKNISLQIGGNTSPSAVSPTEPRNVSYTTGDKFVTLSWLPPLSDGGAPITNYIITKVHKNSVENITTPDGAISYTLTELVNGDTYVFSIAAVNSASLVSPFTTGISVAVSVTVSNFGLISWKKFNDVPVNYGISNNGTWFPFSTQNNGLSVLSKNNSLSELYVSPLETYLNTEEVGKFSIKNVYRKQLPLINGDITSYREAPKFNLSPSFQSFIENMIRASFGNNITYSNTWGSWLISKTLASFSALPGDIKKIYDYAYGMYSTITPPSNTIMEDVWRYNIEAEGCTNPSICPLPGFSYDYALTRPFLLFNTSSISNRATITKVILKAKHDTSRIPGSTFSSEGELLSAEPVSDINTLYFKKALITSNDNIKTQDFNNIDPSIKGSTVIPKLIGIPTEYIEGEPQSDVWTISYDLNVELDPSIITRKGYTKIAVLSNLDESSLPLGWNQLTYKDVTLEITLGVEQTTTPGSVTNLTAGPENKKVTINWSHPLDDGGSGITHYLIKNTNTGETITILEDKTLSCVFSNLVNDSNYTFSVKAVNSLGEGEERFISATPSATVFSSPSLVQNLIGTPLNSSIAISWEPPLSNGGKPILNYELLNLETEESSLIPSTQYSYVFQNLTNNTPYTLRVSAINEIGTGPVNQLVMSPVDGLTVPSIPTIVSLLSTETSALLSFVPTGDGGTPLLQWIIRVINLVTNKESLYYINEENASEYTITNLQKNIPYKIALAVANSIGISAWAYSEPFALQSNEGVFPLLKVPVNHNYNTFSPAPIDLNPFSATYQDYLYPEVVFEDTEAYVQSRDTSYPFFISRSNSKLYLTITAVQYELSLREGWYTLKGDNNTFSLVNELNNLLLQNKVQAVALTSNNNIILRTIQKGSGIFISFENAINKVDKANNIIFGEEPLFVEGTRVYHVENHVPTPEYDAANLKALIESKPTITVRSLPVKETFINELNNRANTYSLQLPNNKIIPNSLTIYYYGNNNNTIFLRDYLGDGILRVRVKETENIGDPISFKYLNDELVNTEIFGKIDYKTGLISNILFPVLFNGSTYESSIKTPLIIGNEAEWPVTIPEHSFLYLKINGVNYTISVPSKAGGKAYSITELSELLNENTVFKQQGLISGNNNGQLYIKNIGYDLTSSVKHSGPDKTISLSNNSYTVNNVNFLLFGMKPKIIDISPFYVTYSYSLNNDSSYKHIWYQTPHFTLVSRGNPSNFITKAHIRYLLDKLNIARPANTKLDHINFSPAFSEKATVRDTLSIKSADNVILPYLEVRRVPAQTEGEYSIRIINPDKQEDIELSSYTYIKEYL